MNSEDAARRKLIENNPELLRVLSDFDAANGLVHDAETPPGIPTIPNEVLLNGEPAKKQEKEETKNQATKLAEMILNSEAVHLFHTRDQEAYAAIEVGGHTEVMPTKSKAFRRHIAYLFYEAQGSAPNGQAMRDALATIDGKAIFDRPEETVFVRLAELEDSIWVDLADSRWRAVRVDADGWEVVENPPVRFRRPKDMGELPEPTSGGDIEELKKFVNVEPKDFILVLAWVIAAYRPKGPYTILYLLGEQGAAKSTTSRVLRKLVDPARADLRTMPRDERDLAIAANNAQILTIDNISKLEPWLSDAICRISTGLGLSTRELYTDTEEIVFDAQRPVLVNGIEELAVRGDFLDRVLMVTCPVIPETARQDEEEFWATFEAVRPRLFGALLDKVVLAMKNLPDVKLARKPRMADFAKWSTAALGLEFLTSYMENVEAATSIVLEAAVIVPYLRELAELNQVWTTGQLRKSLTDKAVESDLKQPGWPKTPEKLAGLLRRLAPALRKEGIRWVKLERPPGTRKRVYKLSKAGADLSQPSEPSQRSLEYVQQIEKNIVIETSSWDGPRGSPPQDRLDNRPEGRSGNEQAIHVPEPTPGKPLKTKMRDSVDGWDGLPAASSKMESTANLEDEQIAAQIQDADDRDPEGWDGSIPVEEP